MAQESVRSASTLSAPAHASTVSFEHAALAQLPQKLLTLAFGSKAVSALEQPPIADKHSKMKLNPRLLPIVLGRYNDLRQGAEVFGEPRFPRAGGRLS